jgi:hypothetical protein
MMEHQMNLHLSGSRRAGIRAASLAVAMIAAVAACGGASSGDDDAVVSLADPSASPDTPGFSSAPQASVDPEEAMLAFQACMKDHGIDLQVATVTGGPVGPGAPVQGGGSNDGAAGEPVQPGTGPLNPEVLKEAEAACRHLLPASGMGDAGATIDPALADQLVEFAQCMRDHGVDFPDPQITIDGGAITAIGGGVEIDPTSQVFQDAQAACAAKLPGPVPAGGATSTGEELPAIEVNP